MLVTVCLLKQAVVTWLLYAREREKARENSKTLILKDSSIRSIWTCLTASPCYSTNTRERCNANCCCNILPVFGIFVIDYVFRRQVLFYLLLTMSSNVKCCYNYLLLCLQTLSVVLFVVVVCVCVRVCVCGRLTVFSL